MKTPTILLLCLLINITSFAQDGVLEERSIIQNDSLRSYLLYIPASYDGSSEWPLVISYHGYSIDASFQMAVDRLDLTADTAEFLLAYPNGLIVDDPFDGPDIGWNYDGLVSENDDVEFSRMIIEDISEDYMVDQERIHATGWSMGSQMIWALACELSDRVASIAGISGPMDDAYMDACTPDRPFSVMLIHGTDDLYWPPEGVEVGGYIFSNPKNTIDYWTNNNNCLEDEAITELEDIVGDDSSTVTVYSNLGCDSDTETFYYDIKGGGHTWPGGSFPGGAWPEFLGPVNRDISANNEMWSFFERNPHPEAGATGGRLEEVSLMHGDSLRSYLLYIPASYDGSSEWPLVISYHGYSIDASFQMAVDRLDLTADTAEFLLAYPNGLIVDDPFDGPDIGWNYDGLVSENDDVEFSRMIIEDISEDYMVDQERIHATGWSMGSQMIWALACELSDRVASIAGISGPMDDAYMDACTPDRPFSVMLIHGTDDLYWPPEGVEVGGYIFSNPKNTIDYWSNNNNCLEDEAITELEDIVGDDSSTVTVYSNLGCDSDTETFYYDIKGGGHTWPGGSFPGGGWPEFLGPVNRDINASAEIIKFFSRNPRSKTSTYNEKEALPSEIALNVYPNPFIERVTIEFRTPITTDVKLNLYNVLGQNVHTIFDRRVSNGNQQISIDLSEMRLSAGTYLLRAQIGDETVTRPIVRLVR